jgi:hypothetical protein
MYICVYMSLCKGRLSGVGTGHIKAAKAARRIAAGGDEDIQFSCCFANEIMSHPIFIIYLMDVCTYL